MNPDDFIKEVYRRMDLRNGKDHKQKYYLTLENFLNQEGAISAVSD